MKTRQEIKAIAKESFAEQRGTAIIFMFLLLLLSGVTSLIGMIPAIGWLLSIAGSFAIIAFSVNLCGAFVDIYKKEKVEVAAPFNEIAVNFFRKVGGIYWVSLWILIWSLLLIVPGIIKSFAYSMAPYILAKHPDVTATDALKLSVRMTDGHKMDLFVLALSFIGWGILSALTFGILYIVYVGPYIQATYSGFFLELRDKALASGAIAPEELGMAAGGQEPVITVDAH